MLNCAKGFESSAPHAPRQAAESGTKQERLLYKPCPDSSVPLNVWLFMRDHSDQATGFDLIAIVR